MLTKLDHKKRSKGIGSSEIGMLIYVEDENGDQKPLSKWGDRHKLWRSKTGKETSSPAKSYMQRGNYMEPALIQWFADEHGVDWYKPPTINHPEYRYIVDSCDGLTYPKGTSRTDMKSGKVHPHRCIEAKVLTGWNKDGFGDPGTDDIPDSYLVQSQWHIGAHKPEDMACEFPVDVDGGRKDYLVKFDEELYMSLVAEAERFWVDYVEKDVEPPVDDYSETTKWLSKYLTQKAGMGLLEADEGQVQLLLQYRKHSLQLKGDESSLDEIKERLMRDIGEYDGIIIPGTKCKVLWKKSKDTQKVGWQKVAEDLANRLIEAGQLDKSGYEEIRDDNTDAREGARRWTPTSLLKHDAGNGAE